MDYSRIEKRKRANRSPSPSQFKPDRSRRRGAEQEGRENRFQSWSSTNQARINKIQEDERHREFVAQEGQFVLRQKRRAAEIRVKEGRARPTDWLTANLRNIDLVKDLINDAVEQDELDFIDPEAILDKLTPKELADVQKDIDEFLDLERNATNKDYWHAVRSICTYRQKGVSGRAVRSVSTDIDALLAPKSLPELEKLEAQINRKLDSDEPIDTDYWQQLLDSLLVYKAKAKLKTLRQSLLADKLSHLRKTNASLALSSKIELTQGDAPVASYMRSSDPEPLLNLDPKDKPLQVISEEDFLRHVLADRRNIIKLGYVSALRKSLNDTTPSQRHLSRKSGEGESRIASSLYDREAAKGVEEDEEIFAGEEQVETKNTDLWRCKYRPRKPRYFNRVQMGYEWNKYNQTHYDHDNPPPKVVQGYKFHIFYPDLIEPSKAPTYKITREGGRKKGETVAPAGEEDTCIIRFMSGPPYEDIAFRIVDRDWDFSAKHERGFKSTFENGILTLHFSFKKVYYRK